MGPVSHTARNGGTGDAEVTVRGGLEEKSPVKNMCTGTGGRASTSNYESLLVVSNFELPEYSFEVYREGRMEG